ncbi:Pentatricopeptide repeat-containing -like protein [Gossypium arboreum]|uniref:Pentatricopeptide repeat-containing-like protein n=1 Tax=Gossypium arboreum TaxID=29729 RepID=A0A0B0N8P6_GOSAR|nr:Pentatricopeptide repeat-containing -like protein [Gossypium arboreum]
MESGPRPGKEQDFGLNRINCSYFVLSFCAFIDDDSMTIRRRIGTMISQLNLRNSWDTNVITLGICVIPCKTMSGTWHWYQYETSCKAIAGLSASICMIQCKTMSGTCVAKLARGSKDIGARFTLST